MRAPPPRRESDKALRKILHERYELTAPPRFHPYVVASALAGAAVTIALFVLSLTGHLKVEVASQGTAAVLTVGALGFGIWQWRLATAERSLDTLYARIDLANQRRLDAEGSPPRALRQGAAKLSEDAPALFFDYFVFTEIDNLEYATQKYVLGLLRPVIVHRAVTLFEERCRKERFRTRAEELVEEGTYFGLTRQLVPKVADWTRRNG